MHSGLNEIAESNDFIIVYPQVSSSYILPLNPYGCFDWWGYSQVKFFFLNKLRIFIINL